MMQVYKLDGNSIKIIACPPEDLRKGDYLLVKDYAADAALITQVVNTEYANVPGILEDLLRETSTEKLEGRNVDFLQMKSFVDMIRDAKIFTCKIRRSLINRKLNYNIAWSPSRSTSQVIKIDEAELLKMIEYHDTRSISIGELQSGVNLAAPLSTIDGRLNIITGKKGTGKSHLAKLLVLGLAAHGGLCIVFDVNGEYVNLDQHLNKHDHTDYSIRVLAPGENFKVSLEYTGLRTLMSIVTAVLDLPANSAWEIRRIWNLLAKNKSLTMENLGKAISAVSNRYIQDALRRRYENLLNSGLFTDCPYETTTLEEWINDIQNGGAIIINLQRLPSSLRRIVVEFMLSKLSDLLENWLIRAVFLFAEEAHLYLRGTYWENIVTRMRHLGIFPTFVTNQPDSISDSIYRQADNIFLFNFTNENDLATVSKATMVDAQTVNTIAKELPPHHCLVLGNVVDNFPLIVKIHALKVRAMGQTRLFFRTNPTSEPMKTPLPN